MFNKNKKSWPKSFCYIIKWILLPYEGLLEFIRVNCPWEIHIMAIVRFSFLSKLNTIYFKEVILLFWYKKILCHFTELIRLSLDCYRKWSNLVVVNLFQIYGGWSTNLISWLKYDFIFTILQCVKKLLKESGKLLHWWKIYLRRRYSFDDLCLKKSDCTYQYANNDFSKQTIESKLSTLIQAKFNNIFLKLLSDLNIMNVTKI